MNLFGKDKLNFVSSVQYQCQSNPCDVNAMCVRDSVLSSNFTCVCNSGFAGDGFTCESE